MVMLQNIKHALNRLEMIFSNFKASDIFLTGSKYDIPIKIKIINEPPHDKTNKMACAPSEDSDQPGHQPSLIRVFAVRMKKAWVLSYPLSAQ